MMEAQTQTPTYPEKYIHVRQHDPAHFTGYETRDLAKTDFAVNGETQGIKVSLGTWKKTGAKVIQKFLFDRGAGWTNERVRAWFAEHPDFRVTLPPENMTEDVSVQSVLNDMACTLELMPSQEHSIYHVHVIREGWGKNRRINPQGIQAHDYFTKDFLRTLLPMLEASAVQAVTLTAKEDANGDPPTRMPELVQELLRHGHPPTLVNILFDQGFVGNTVGFFRNVQYVEHAVTDARGIPRDVITAEFHMADTDAARHTRQLISYAWSHGFQQALGLSINYRANALFTEVDGRPAFRFDTATHHVSTELVPNPAAHGGIVSVIQSIMDTENTHEAEHMAPDAQGTTPEPPDTSDVSSETPAAQITQQTPPESATQTEETPATQHVTPPADETPPDTIPDTADETSAPVPEEVSAMQAELESMKSVLSGLTDTLKTVTGAVTEMQQEKTKQALSVIVTQNTVLDQDAKTALLEDIAKGTLKTTEDVTHAVTLVEAATQRAVAATQSQQGAPVFPGMSQFPAGVVKDPSEVNMIRSKMLWNVPLTQSEQDMVSKYGIEQFMGVKEEYISLTGDNGLTMQFDQDKFNRGIGAFAQATSMTTTTYPDFLRNILIGRAEAHWKDQDKSHLKVVKVGEPFSDTKQADEYVLGQIADIATVAEDGDYGEVTAPYSETISSTVAKHGGILSFSEETLLNDETDLIKQTTDLFVAAMNRTIAGKVWKMQAGYSTAFNDEDLGDSVGTGVLYSADRSNYVNGDISIANIQSLVNLLLTQTDIAATEGTGQGIILKPYLAVCNIINTGLVRRILNGDYEVASSDVSTALDLGFTPDRVIGVHPNYLYGKPGAVFLYPNPQEFAGAEIRYFRGKSVPDLVFEGNQQPAFGYAFSSDRMLLKLKMRFRLTRKRKKAFHALFPST